MSQESLSEFEEEFHVPVRPFDWPWDVNEAIWPCRHCPVWRAELILVDAAIWVREWHAGGCQVWGEIDRMDDA